MLSVSSVNSCSKWTDTEKGQGSTFTITLPLVESPIEEWSGADLPGGMAGAHLVLAPGQDFTILVADDRETNRTVLEGMLAAAGFHTRIATDGDEALETLRTYDDIDLVLGEIGTRYLPASNR